jgi:hypothetical protein
VEKKNYFPAQGLTPVVSPRRFIVRYGGSRHHLSLHITDIRSKMAENRMVGRAPKGELLLACERQTLEA